MLLRAGVCTLFRVSKSITLTQTQIDDRCQRVPDWQCSGSQLSRSLKFADFVTAFGCMAQIALIAERMGHHPDWHQVYNRLTICLTTHDAGGLTELDFELAQHIDAIVSQVALVD